MTTIGSMFSGIGGLDLGISMALKEEGHRVKVSWFCDQDVFARQVMSFHHPSAKAYENIYEISTPYRSQFKKYPSKVNIITAGFPCKNISIARLRSGANVEGIKGNQSGLIIPSMLLFRRLKPDFIVLENVRGVLVDANMRYIVLTLARLGYAVSWAAVPAGMLDASHLRDRVFIIAKKVSSSFQLPDFPVFSADIVNEVKSQIGPIWKKTPEGMSRLLPVGAIPDAYRHPFTEQKVRFRCELNALGNAVAPPSAKVVGLTMLRGPNRPEYPSGGPFVKKSGNSWKSPPESIGVAALNIDAIEPHQSWPRAGYACVVKGEVLVVGLSEPAPVWGMVDGKKRNKFRPYKMNSAEEDEWLERTGKDPRWPTPVAMLSNKKPRDPSTPGFATSCEVYRDSLSDSVQVEEFSPGSPARILNPEWVSWMMGFPPGWLDIPPVPTGCTTPGGRGIGIQPKYSLIENPQTTLFARE